MISGINGSDSIGPNIPQTLSETLMGFGPGGISFPGSATLEQFHWDKFPSYVIPLARSLKC